ncbi:hypothetical protein BN946_scf185042.g180 [Trametes cinnabarina]|uniref:Major facilitator superfamily (MFS) profile domain-containing protein n=1 Tax=Pycnoporus cinnabarinus TaxID=5643 RepID=A0A060SA78_PYCCI|nr:hypothetical protein BN946_scf185042.g180 [Trametes cinnabarina]
MYSVWTRENAERDHAANNNNTFSHCPNQQSSSSSTAISTATGVGAPTMEPQPNSPLSNGGTDSNTQSGLLPSPAKSSDESPNVVVTTATVHISASGTASVFSSNVPTASSDAGTGGISSGGSAASTQTTSDGSDKIAAASGSAAGDAGTRPSSRITDIVGAAFQTTRTMLMHKDANAKVSCKDRRKQYIVAFTTVSLCEENRTLDLDLNARTTLGMASEDRQEVVGGSGTPPVQLDIEHAVVMDDPRAWSNIRKMSVVATVSMASMITGLGANIYNRFTFFANAAAISQIEEELHASSGQISLSLSLFTAIQGTMPLMWSVFSEFWGRKKVYLVSTALCMVGCIVAALSKTIGVLIGMRCIQALGAPLLGPSLGPVLGGVLTKGFDWRATFWFLVIFVGICLMLFVPFKDTFRRERSLVYQAALKRRLAQQSAKGSETSTLSQVTATSPVVQSPEPNEKTRALVSAADDKHAVDEQTGDKDLEKAQQLAGGDVVAPLNEVTLSLADVNPVNPIVHVLRRMNNLTILFASGLIFAFSYSIAYTCSRTLADKYDYNAMQIGLVLLAFGIGSLLGSVLGGRYSDFVFRKLRARNGGVSSAEMRLESTLVPMVFFPPSVIAYGWVCERHVNVGAICVMLFLAGFFSICIYSSTLAYIVDANVGRSSSAVATNSAFRGLTAFVAAEVAVPLQEAIGDGGLYSLWAGLMVLSDLLILLVWWKGAAWREKWVLKERGVSIS